MPLIHLNVNQIEVSEDNLGKLRSIFDSDDDTLLKGLACMNPFSTSIERQVEHFLESGIGSEQSNSIKFNLQSSSNEEKESIFIVDDDDDDDDEDKEDEVKDQMEIIDDETQNLTISKQVTKRPLGTPGCSPGTSPIRKKEKSETKSSIVIPTVNEVEEKEVNVDAESQLELKINHHKLFQKMYPLGYIDSAKWHLVAYPRVQDIIASVDVPKYTWMKDGTQISRIIHKSYDQLMSHQSLISSLIEKPMVVPDGPVSAHVVGLANSLDKDCAHYQWKYIGPIPLFISCYASSTLYQPGQLSKEQCQTMLTVDFINNIRSVWTEDQSSTQSASSIWVGPMVISSGECLTSPSSLHQVGQCDFRLEVFVPLYRGTPFNRLHKKLSTNMYRLIGDYVSRRNIQHQITDEFELSPIGHDDVPFSYEMFKDERFDHRGAAVRQRESLCKKEQLEEVSTNNPVFNYVRFKEWNGKTPKEITEDCDLVRNPENNIELTKYQIQYLHWMMHQEKQNTSVMEQTRCILGLKLYCPAYTNYTEENKTLHLEQLGYIYVNKKPCKLGIVQSYESLSTRWTEIFETRQQYENEAWMKEFLKYDDTKLWCSNFDYHYTSYYSSVPEDSVLDQEFEKMQNIATRRGGINGATMRLGKTIMSLALIAREKKYNSAVGPTLILAPDGAIQQSWVPALKRYAPHLRVLDTKKDSQRKKILKNENTEFTPETVATNFDVILAPPSLLSFLDYDKVVFSKIPFHRVILDEGHLFAGKTSDISYLKSKYFWILSGTCYGGGSVQANVLNPLILGNFGKKITEALTGDNNHFSGKDPNDVDMLLQHRQLLKHIVKCMNATNELVQIETASRNPLINIHWINDEEFPDFKRFYNKVIRSAPAQRLFMDNRSAVSRARNLTFGKRLRGFCTSYFDVMQLLQEAHQAQENVAVAGNDVSENGASSSIPSSNQLMIPNLVVELDSENKNGDTTYFIQPEATCPICLDELDPDQSYVMGCRHPICAICLMGLFSTSQGYSALEPVSQRRRRCPTCRCEGPITDVRKVKWTHLAVEDETSSHLHVISEDDEKVDEDEQKESNDAEGDEFSQTPDQHPKMVYLLNILQQTYSNLSTETKRPKTVIFCEQMESLLGIFQFLQSNSTWRNRVLRIATQDTATRKGKIFTQFTAPNSCYDLLILPVKQCSVGIDLSCANRIIFVQPLIDKATEQQAINRIYHIKKESEEPMHVDYLVLKNTVEELIVQNFPSEQQISSMTQQQRTAFEHARTVRNTLASQNDRGRGGGRLSMNTALDREVKTNLNWLIKLELHTRIPEHYNHP